ncbi:light-harvesting protein [Sphingomonas sp. IBVSS1]|jgi:light-harvesting complex 1 beta chain|uniref:Light-harvesting protein n=1 Tax=Sandarakinorhabdus cyanobacteriorum TaxID=1981098 RepID=A0A255YV27_9SPHN|nr:light-harvesting antenna LH1, beta subunit [Sandarakinorhabdus cyanobacteriorum]OSZ72352.1 light-harvesting protein [Sphingomonas sp. IBVSS1]OYQ33068.1 light-harvesting protein [Sandarakinorhabdus cyanobacteriorum]
MSDNKIGPGTYLTDAEAKEFHRGFVVSMAFFVIVAVIAHWLVWVWRPWLGSKRAFAATEIHQIQQADAASVAAPRA